MQIALGGGQPPTKRRWLYRLTHLWWPVVAADMDFARFDITSNVGPNLSGGKLNADGRVGYSCQPSPRRVVVWFILDVLLGLLWAPGDGAMAWAGQWLC